jgi:endonuclease III
MVQVRGVIWRLLQLCPTPQAAISAEVEAIQGIIQPLGLFRKRARAIQRFSAEFLHKEVGGQLQGVEGGPVPSNRSSLGASTLNVCHVGKSSSSNQSQY